MGRCTVDTSTRLWGRTLYCVKALDTGFLMRLSDLAQFRFLVRKKPCYKSRNCSESDGIRSDLASNHECTISTNTSDQHVIPAFERYLARAAQQVYKNKQDGMRVWSFLLVIRCRSCCKGSIVRCSAIGCK